MKVAVVVHDAESEAGFVFARVSCDYLGTGTWHALLELRRRRGASNTGLSFLCSHCVSFFFFRATSRPAVLARGGNGHVIVTTEVKFLRQGPCVKHSCIPCRLRLGVFLQSRISEKVYMLEPRHYHSKVFVSPAVSETNRARLTRSSMPGPSPRAALLLLMWSYISRAWIISLFRFGQSSQGGIAAAALLMGAPLSSIERLTAGEKADLSLLAGGRARELLFLTVLICTCTIAVSVGRFGSSGKASRRHGASEDEDDVAGEEEEDQNDDSGAISTGPTPLEKVAGASIGFARLGLALFLMSSAPESRLEAIGLNVTQSGESTMVHLAAGVFTLELLDQGMIQLIVALGLGCPTAVILPEMAAYVYALASWQVRHLGQWTTFVYRDENVLWLGLNVLGALALVWGLIKRSRAQ
jgi:hypothetical protein